MSTLKAAYTLGESIAPNFWGATKRASDCRRRNPCAGGRTSVLRQGRIEEWRQGNQPRPARDGDGHR